MNENEVYDLLTADGVKADEAEKLRGKCHMFIYSTLNCSVIELGSMYDS
jgi:hypothetical protein